MQNANPVKYWLAINFNVIKKRYIRLRYESIRV